MQALWIVLIVIAALLVLTLLVGLLATFALFFVSPKFDRENPKPDPLMGETLPAYVKATDREASRLREVYPHERVEVKSRDGLRLVGDFYINENKTDKTVLCVHGYNSCGYSDFAPMVAPILAHGCNCLLIDQRHYGESEGSHTGFGLLERRDLPVWIDLVNGYFPEGKIVLYGVSMGAATVMLAGALDLPKTVVGIVEDCGFTSVRETFADVLKRLTRLPSFPLVPLVSGLARLLLKLDLRTDARDAVAKAKVPMLFLHGDADAFIPASMCKALYEACGGEKYMHIYEGAAHAQSHYMRPEDYERDFFAFIDAVM